MKDITLVCNAHLDVVWLWEWEEGAAEALSTFRTAADFCEEYEGFVFNHNESILYQWIEEYDPILFQRIRKLVEKGQWQIMGGWYLQPDCVMISGESFVRQIYEGRKYFLNTFNKIPRIAVNFDSFGHSRTLPQILKKSGYVGYVVCRAGNAEKEASSNDFCWRALDGSEVIVHYSDENYNTVFGKATDELGAWLDKHKEEKNGMFLWGIGDHGGGPSRLDMKNLQAFYDNNPNVQFHHGTLEEYFSRLDIAELPVYEKPLTPVSEGCYTSQAEVKRLHRKLENGLLSCEKMVSCAASQGLLQYTDSDLAIAWNSLMRAQFHDALPGSSIKAVAKATIMQLGHGIEIVSRLKAKAFFALSSGQPRCKENQSSILVFNPHPFDAAVTVDCEASLPVQNWNNTYMMPILTQNGKSIPCQISKEGSSFEIDWRKRCVFNAIIPAFSMRKFDCAFYEAPTRPAYNITPINDKFSFCGDRISAAINAKTGLMDFLCVDNKPILKDGSFRLVVMKDFYNSWGVGFKSFEDTHGEFALMDKEEGTYYSGLGDNLADSVRVVEEGEVRTVIEAVFRYNHSSAQMLYKLYKHSNELELELNIIWLEKDCLLKLCIPTLINNGTFTAQTAYGRQTVAADGTEQIMHQWCALEDSCNDMVTAIINDGVYGVNCQNDEMRISLVRAAGYGMSDLGQRKALHLNRVNERMDQGEHNYNFCLLFGSQEQVMHGLDRAALLKNEPVYALAYNPSGAGEIIEKCVLVDAKNIVLSAFKKQNNSDNFILRLYESEGVKTTTAIKVYNCQAAFDFLPFEIRTLSYDAKNNTLLEIGILEDLQCKI